MRTRFVWDFTHNLKRAQIEDMHPWVQFILPVQGGWRIFESETDYLTSLSQV